MGIIRVNYLMILRVVKVKVMLKTIEDTMNFTDKTQAVFELICLIYYLLLLTHFCACIFNKIA